jgi:two-component system, OmpR family, response regulator
VQATIAAKKRILVIDDEPSVTRLTKMNLELTGSYEVRGENDPRNTLAVAREFRPDLILLDVMMPAMDGGEVASRLGADPQLKDVPIVFLTGIVSRRETQGGELVTPGGRFVAKPVSLVELIQIIEESLPTARRA